MNQIKVLLYMCLIVIIMAIHSEAGSSCRGGNERCSYQWLGFNGERDAQGRARGDCCSPNFCDQRSTPGVYTACNRVTGNGMCYGVCRP